MWRQHILLSICGFIWIARTTGAWIQPSVSIHHRSKPSFNVLGDGRHRTTTIQPPVARHVLLQRCPTNILQPRVYTSRFKETRIMVTTNSANSDASLNSGNDSMSVSTMEIPVPRMTNSTISASIIDDKNGDDGDEEEYEYIEYELLTEAEFVGSEWLVGTCWNNNPSKIEETWARLIVDQKSGKNVAVWGDNSQGSWSLDVASQFLSISKENVIMGKDIWACTVTDYYYLQGNIRGWKYWLPAAVLGQWQARRLNVDTDEAGVAPWFQQQNPIGESNN